MATDNKSLTQKMVQAGEAAGVPATQAAKLDVVAKIFVGKGTTLARALSKSMDAERFAGIIISKVRGNDALTSIACNNPASIFAACLEIAHVGLDPSIPNEAWLIPYKNEAKAQYGYKGLGKLAAEAAMERGDPLALLRQEKICENDRYERVLGSDMGIVHIPPDFGEPRGKAIGYYAIAKTKAGLLYFDEMTKEEVVDHQKRFSKGLENPKSPFYGGQKSENFDAYGLKTVLRRMIQRYMPMSQKLARAVHNDADSDTPAIEIDPTILSGTPDPETPKQIENSAPEGGGNINENF